jgi:integrase
MNRRPSGLSLSKGLVGYEQFRAAEGLKPTTLVNYRQHLRLWLKYAGDFQIDELRPQDIRAFLAWFRTEYKPKRVTGDERPLSSKTIRNIWVTLSSFCRWAEAEFEIANPMRNVPAPRFQEAPVEPFSKEEDINPHDTA